VYIDHDRLFIDFHPYAMLRFPPNTVEIVGKQDLVLTVKDEGLAEEKWVRRGNIVVQTPDFSEGIEIDRRQARYQCSIKTERPFEESLNYKPDKEQTALLEAHPVYSLLQIAEPAESKEWFERDKKARISIVAEIKTPALAFGSKRPPVRVIGGTWVCAIKEQMRDVVCTSRRLVEDHNLVTVQSLAPRLQQSMKRTFECVATHLFLVPTPGNDTEEDKTQNDERGYSPDLLSDYPAYNAFARSLLLYLEQEFINFSSEYRIKVMENQQKNAEGTVTGDGTYRIVIYRLRENELQSEDTLSNLLDREMGRDVLPWIHDLLIECDCEDGCSACCGGLGTIDSVSYTSEHIDPTQFTEQDVFSRVRAYRLVCGLLSKEPDWKRFGAEREKQQKEGIEQIEQPTVTDKELRQLVTEIIGTKKSSHTNGLWTKLFGQFMVLDPEWVASASWATADNEMDIGTLGNRWLGYYTTDGNRLVLRKKWDGKNQTRDQLKATLVHEYTHNWQFKCGESFNATEHLYGEEALQYFNSGGGDTGCIESSKLVIEGHARWADHQFRFHSGMGSYYKPTDPEGWNEYKVGYYLIENIEKTFGRHGLFLWLKHGSDYEGPPLRSRNKKLQWPFTLTEALDAFGLREEALEGEFNGIDVLEVEKTEITEPISDDTPFNKDS
jgi:hypothetical protein